MAVLIGHASIDERGKASGGQAGDQTGKEVCIRTWYVSGNGWDTLLRPKTSALAEKMATICEWICNSNLVGYDQGQRNTLYNELEKLNWDYKKLTTKCETDCSALMGTCAKASGSNVQRVSGNCCYTGNQKQLFLASNDFIALTDKKYLTSDQYLKRGDILLRTSGHTAMVLSNGALAEAGSTVGTPAKTTENAAAANLGTVSSGNGYRCRTIPLSSIARIQIYINSKKKTLDTIMKETGADYAINGTLYNMSSWTACENVKADGVVISTQPKWSNEGFYWTSGSDITWGYVPVNAGNATNYLFGNGLITGNGAQQAVNWSSDLRGSRGRTLMGIDTSNNLVLYTCLDSKAPLTPEGARAKMISLKCLKGAINLDGGSSVGWYDKQNNSYQRPGKGTVQNYVLIYFKNSGTSTKITVPYAEPTVTVRQGSRGTGVSWVQYILYQLGYGTGTLSAFVDGIFGANTKASVIKFQKAKGLEADGIVGPFTRNALRSAIS